jgi:transglutaminase-like putative cysteine protease
MPFNLIDAQDTMTDTLPNPPPEACLAATDLVDSEHPDVVAFARQHSQGANLRERAVALYHAVRDGFRYDPYRTDLRPAGMRASQVIAKGYGWCTPKAALLAAVCRASGIPARLGYADVRNHLSTEKMRASMGTDEFVWHVYTDLWLDGAWRKATPAFNIQLCERFGLLPLEFNGVADSIYHPFDQAGNRHMEYIRQRGAYVEMPLAQMIETFRVIYPNWVKAGSDINALAEGDFLADVSNENRGEANNY